ncbi:TPA: Dam family site-specific DNA-(adenine-N6)-methyltransferase [Escherichia coli]|nr:Dam family site-specific DNA-(adenine-N6)-methyltransferase [Escherichia coli]EHU9029585.1 Dam family site-specific DNA-(adenine-N6)-methyltransferase [Escherichia coli]EHY4934507.1 Dam family site-specific DNA-(adenine-N6)-methyltransferase [Escherichia coli]EJP4482386.1 Dam family site-specific DNA-(adenine-N6)-methyltransferase [Escherichia coli]ELJ7003920.1 Dam family site-specific DNA-(adenine-N6)-methyltransferase [Escherichia coli]
MIRSLVKWPGGKGRVIPDLLQHLPKADCLIEPFVGGASVFLNTEYRRYVLGDINPDLINLYRQITHWPDAVIDAARPLFKVYGDKDGYKWIRDDFNARARDCMAPHDMFENGPDVAKVLRAAQFLYLNRHGYNGVVRYNRQGGYNVPFGKHKSPPYFPEEQIRLFSEKANDTKAIFLCCPFQNTIKVMTGSDSVIYCDPPYLPESETANFTQYHSTPFGKKEHRQLVAALLAANRETGASVVISNSDTPETREIYQPFNLHEISVQRSVSTDKNNRNKAKEVIGVLPVCDCCGRHGGSYCPDCGPCAGYSVGRIEESDSDVLPGYWESEENPIPL